MGYSINSGVYQVFNKRTKSMMEFINVTVNDNQTEVTPDVHEDHYLTGQNDEQDVPNNIGKNYILLRMMEIEMVMMRILLMKEKNNYQGIFQKLNPRM